MVVAAARTQCLGLSMSVVLQLAEERVLLGQQHFDVLHTHPDDPGADVRLQSVDALIVRDGEETRGALQPDSGTINLTSLQFLCAYTMN